MRLIIILIAASLLALGLGSYNDHSLRQLSIQAIDLNPSDRGYAGFQESAVVLPVKIGGDERRALKLSFSGKGQALTLGLEVHASRADFEIFRLNHRALPSKCTAVRVGTVACTIQVKIPPTDQYLTLTAPRSTNIQAINVTVLNARHVVQTGHMSVITALCLLAALAPLFWISSVRTGNFLICGIAGIWLAVVDIHFFFATLGVLAIFYGMLRMMERGANRARPFFAVLFGVIAMLVIVKSIIPLSGKFFANPGEMFMLPLGFSYFMIRIVDLGFKSYSRQLKQISPLDYFSYLLFPPTLAAGPIMSIVEFRNSAKFYTRFDDRAVGILRIISGLTKKTLADAILAYLVTRNLDSGFYGADNHHVPIVLFASALFVYLDFSAYSDLAIGVARWWGWRVPENFNFPFIRRSMREFWQNWHMSLTQWVTRHIFMQASMEVRRSPRWMQITLPTFAAMLTIGLWHGFEFVWVLWAVHHTIAILAGDLLMRANFLSAVPGNILAKTAANWLKATFEILFVWYWFALSQAFTLTLSVPEALDNYASLLSFGLF